MITMTTAKGYGENGFMCANLRFTRENTRSSMSRAIEVWGSQSLDVITMTYLQTRQSIVVNDKDDVLLCFVRFVWDAQHPSYCPLNLI